jgi:hypothetical protein
LHRFGWLIDSRNNGLDLFLHCAKYIPRKGKGFPSMNVERSIGMTTEKKAPLWQSALIIIGVSVAGWAMFLAIAHYIVSQF